MNILGHVQAARALLTWFYNHKLIDGEEYVGMLKDVVRQEHEFRICRSKDAFDSFYQARRIIKRKHVDRQRDWDIYTCQVCGKFHLCNRPPFIRMKRLAARARRQEAMDA